MATPMQVVCEICADSNYREDFPPRTRPVHATAHDLADMLVHHAGLHDDLGRVDFTVSVATEEETRRAAARRLTQLSQEVEGGYR
jgi:hypothetical protein